MNSKSIVIYATRCGSTAEIARAIGQTINENGAVADIQAVENVTNLSDYGQIIIGSAVRYSQWMPEAVKFVQQHHLILNERKTAFFAVHLMNLGDDETSRKQRTAYLAPMRALVPHAAEAYFAGVADLTKVSFLERLIGKAVKTPEGDLRDWSLIHTWAKSLAGTKG